MVLIVFLNGLLTDCHVIPSNQHTNNGVLTDSTAPDLVQVISSSIMSGSGQQASEILLPATNGETLVGHKRSVAADTNGSTHTQGFAVFEGLEGDEVEPFMQAVHHSSNSQQLVLPAQAGVSLGCISNVTEGTRDVIAEFKHAFDECPASLLSIGSNAVNERTLCPWTYVEHTDENR